jgi:hypothetical protein
MIRGAREASHFLASGFAVSWIPLIASRRKTVWLNSLKIQ